MNRGPFFQPPVVLLAAALLFGLLLFLFLFFQIGLITIAFSKLGLTPAQGFLLLVTTLFGSGVNIPAWRTGRMVPVVPRGIGSLFFRHVRPYQFGPGETELKEQVVAVNVGGCVIPCLLSAYFVSQIGLTPALLVAVAIVTAACYKLARPIPGVGIGVPVLIPPLVTALTAMLIAPADIAPHVAYISGSLGTLLGADVLHLATPRSKALLDAPLLSIGGAGTFDGIFITGIIAVLLA